jgi:HTH-type transcriptional regulator/antitoxin HigA
MSTATTKRRPGARKSRASRPPAPAADYMALVRAFPLKPIRDDADYGRAAGVLDGLVLRDLTAGERDYLDALTLMVEAYDDEHHPIPDDDRPPHERLRALMDDNGVSQAQMRQVLGVAQSTMSMILRGQRGITKDAVMKLAVHFKLNPSYFL